MIRFIFFFTIFLFTSSLSYSDAKNCIDDENEDSVALACLDKKLKSTELDQTRALKVVLSKILAEDNHAGLKQKIERSQAEWASYKENHCTVKSSLQLKNLDQQVTLLKCEITLTKLRADELRALVPNEDTCGCTSHSLDKIQFKTPISASDE